VRHSTADTDVVVAGAPNDVQDKYGNPKDEEFFRSLLKSSPVLYRQTFAWLSAGEEKDLKGLYIGEGPALVLIRAALMGLQTVDRMSLDYWRKGERLYWRRSANC
jgi:hypothetical protein